MAGTPSAQEVAEALAMTLERQDADGAPWCPPYDGIALRRWVTDRSASLGTGIRRVVRFARLMAIADGRDYARFLYAGISTLRARLFRHALQTAAAQGRLHAAVALLTDSAAILREPAMAAADSDQFEIDFSQMPRLAALLDIIHNALGFVAVADLLAPIVHQGTPKKSADDIARSLHAALNEWLRERLESTTHILQAQRIRTFLKSRGHVVPEAVDDESILLFWISAATAAEDERIDGFRLYRSAACSMLRYRHALRDAAAARQLEEALQQGPDAVNGEDRLDSAEAAEVAKSSIELWRSPLGALASTAGRVKWLTQKEQQALLNYLGGPAGNDDSDVGADESEATPWHGGLAGDERFDLAFWRTLLRADVFGTAQASIVGRLRKRAAPEEAIAQVMSPVGDQSYVSAAAAYEDIRKQLGLECLAALAILMEAGAAEAIILLDYLGGRQAVTSIIGASFESIPSAANDNSGSEMLSRTSAPALRSAIAEPGCVAQNAARDLLVAALAAMRKVGRIGFRREDRADAGMLAALKVGASAIVEVDRELDRLTAVLSQKSVSGDIAADRERFLTAFRSIYVAAPVK